MNILRPHVPPREQSIKYLEKLGIKNADHLIGRSGGVTIIISEENPLPPLTDSQESMTENQKVQEEDARLLFEAFKKNLPAGTIDFLALYLSNYCKDLRRKLVLTGLLQRRLIP